MDGLSKLNYLHLTMKMWHGEYEFFLMVEMLVSYFSVSFNYVIWKVLDSEAYLSLEIEYVGQVEELETRFRIAILGANYRTVRRTASEYFLFYFYTYFLF